MKPATAGAPYRVPPEPSRWPAILLAVAVHVLLLAFLWFGISWQNNEPVAVEAEVWDMKTQAAAPVAPPPQEAEPEPEPAPAPPVPKVVEQPVEQPAPAPAPDIKLERQKEREKKRKEELLKKEQEQRELAEKKARDEAKAKDLAEKKAAEKKKADELAKKEAEKKEVEKKEADKKEAEKKLADKKKAEKEAKAKEAAENAKLAKLHDAEMRRMLEAAGSGGSGTAARSTAPRMDSGYQAAIASKVKSNTNYTGSTDAPGNPRVEFQIEQLPTGEIISVKKTKSSGLPGFDEAVEKGIIKSSPLPRKKDGTVERSFPISFKLKDLE
jgi:colicin import membrane protein